MKIAAIVASLLFAAAAFADTPRVLPIARDGITSDNVGAAGLNVSHDVNGDGIRDIVTCAAGNAFALAKRGNGFATVWYSEPLNCTAVRVGDRDDDGSPEIFVASQPSGGTGAVISVFDPRTFAAARGTATLPGTQPIDDLAVGDPDHDGHMEILAVTEDATYMYDAKTLALEWAATGFGGREIAIGNIDDDGRIEIVVNGPTGYVLDAYVRGQKWGYVGGFGRTMAVGNVDADPELEIVFTPSWSTQFTILEGDTMQTSTVSITGGWNYIDTIAVADTTGDGIGEIVTGNNQWGSIRGHRRSDGVELWAVNNPEHGTMAVAAGDVDGDGVVEALWGAGATSSGKDALFVASTVTKQIEWSTPDLDYSFHGAVADLDGDGRLELIVGVGGTDSGYRGGQIEVFDAQTRVSKGLLTLPGTSGWGFPHISGLAVGQLDSDPAKEILAFSSTLHAWDGATLMHQWNSPSSATFRQGGVVMNIDNDAVDEIIVGTGDNKVVVLNGASAIIQWSSPVLEGYSILDLDVADVNGNGLYDVVAGTSSALYVYEIPTSIERLKASLFSIRSVAATSSGGGEIAVGLESSGRVRTYAGTTLTQSWECTTSEVPNVLVYANAGGRVRLAMGGSTGLLRLFPLGGTSCPTAETIRLGRAGIVGLSFPDTTGDGRGELLVAFGSQYVLNLFGWESEARGDVNLDGMISDADIDALIAYLLAGGPGAPPGADVNADGRIALDDVFYLINYRKGTGAAPPP